MVYKITTVKLDKIIETVKLSKSAPIIRIKDSVFWRLLAAFLENASDRIKEKIDTNKMIIVTINM